MTILTFYPGQVYKDKKGNIRAVRKVRGKWVYFSHRDTLYVHGAGHSIKHIKQYSNKLIGHLPVVL